MNQPLVSIIIPCYNQAPYLQECLQSVLNQTYDNWECIVIDDGSADTPVKIVQKFIDKDPRFQFFSQQNQGVSATRNLGISKSRGEYLQFVDGDDILQPFKLEYQVTTMQKNPKIDVIYGGSRYFFHGDQEHYPVHPSGIIPAIELKYFDAKQLDVLLFRNIATVCAALYKREIFEKIKFEATAFEDYLVNLQCADLGYRFHFETAENGYCFVRITSQSQMLRHIADEKDVALFREEFRKIKNAHPSKLHPNVSENKQTSEKAPVSQKDRIKKILVDLTPPLFLKILKK